MSSAGGVPSLTISSSSSSVSVNGEVELSIKGCVSQMKPCEIK